MACGIKFHLIFVEQINCAISFDVKLVPLLLNTDHSVMACGIKFHLIFVEQINCAISFDVKLVPLLLNTDHSVPIRLKNLNKPLIQAAK